MTQVEFIVSIFILFMISCGNANYLRKTIDTSSNLRKTSDTGSNSTFLETNSTFLETNSTFTEDIDTDYFENITSNVTTQNCTETGKISQTCSLNGFCLENGNCKCLDGWVTHNPNKSSQNYQCNYQQKSRFIAFVLEFGFFLGTGSLYLENIELGMTQIFIALSIHFTLPIVKTMNKDLHGNPSAEINVLLIMAGLLSLVLCIIAYFYNNASLLISLICPFSVLVHIVYLKLTGATVINENAPITPIKFFKAIRLCVTGLSIIMIFFGVATDGNGVSTSKFM